MYAFRIPVSGSRDLPDVFAVDSYGKAVYAFEIKSTTRRVVKVKRKQITRLLRFCKAFERIAKTAALLAVYSYRLRRWFVWEVDKSAPYYSEAVIVLDFQNSGAVVRKGDFLNRGIYSEMFTKLLNPKRGSFQR